MSVYGISVPAPFKGKKEVDIFYAKSIDKLLGDE